MNVLGRIHVSFTCTAEAMWKLGRSLRKDSGEAIHEKIQRIKNFEWDLALARIPKFANNPRKVCGRVRGSDSWRILHLGSTGRFVPWLKQSIVGATTLHSL